MIFICFICYNIFRSKLIFLINLAKSNRKGGYMLKLKKSAAYLLSVLLILSTVLILPFTVSAAEDEGEAVTAGITGDCTWSADGKGTLTISGNGRMADYELDPDNSQIDPDNVKLKFTYPWNSLRIKSIVVEEGVTYIGNQAFACFPLLESVSLPNSLEEIGDFSFFQCKSLKSVTLPEGLKTLGTYTFVNNDSLESISIPSTVERYGIYSFAFNKNLKSVKFAEGLTTIGDSAFAYCESLKSVTFPESMKNIHMDAFSSSGLTSFNYSENMTEIGGYAFHGTPWYDNQPNGLIYIGKVAYFYKGNCPATVRVKDGTVAISANAFSEGENLTTVVLPDSMQFIGEYAFAGCTKLENINFSDNIKIVGAYAMLDTKWYENQPDGYVYIGKAFYCLKGNAYSRSVTVPDGTYSVSGMAFSEAENVSSITLPDSVEYIGSNSFMFCSKLRNVNLPGKIEIIEYYTFASCGLLKKVTIPDGVKSIEFGAFAYCINLESAIIPESVTYIAPDAFDGCEKLTIYGYSGSYAEEYANRMNIPFEAIEREKLTGDLNGDNKIDVFDSLIIQKHAAGTQTLSEEQLALADVNGDGNVDILDAMEIQKFASGKITEFKK